MPDAINVSGRNGFFYRSGPSVHDTTAPDIRIVPLP